MLPYLAWNSSLISSILFRVIRYPRSYACCSSALTLARYSRYSFRLIPAMTVFNQVSNKIATFLCPNQIGFVFQLAFQRVAHIQSIGRQS